MQKGLYNLIIYLNNGRTIRIGKLGVFYFKKGYYTYTGSSQNSLQKRIERHLSTQKRLHWHIDYLLKHAKILKVGLYEASKEYECNLSNEIGLLTGAEIAINGFGSSDCACKTHLYFFRKKPFFITDNPESRFSILRNMKNYGL